MDGLKNSCYIPSYEGGLHIASSCWPVVKFRQIIKGLSMSLWLIVGLGGFVGAILRYWISGWIQSGFITFPFGTLGVNFIGSLLLALIMYASEYRGVFGEETRAFLTIGVLGSFTTMSTFSFESMKLLEQNEHMLFGLNLVGTVALCLLAIYLGKMIITVLGIK
jgi:CrcB protein